MLVSAIHQHESVIRTPMSPPSWTSLPPPTPLGCHRALGLSSQHHIANSHWLFCFMCGKVYGLEKENGNPLQYSCLENPVDRGAWWAAVHRVAQSRIRLKRLSMHACMHALEKEMATHSSILAWSIPGTEEPGGLPSMGLHRVGHDWSDLTAAALARYMFPCYSLNSSHPLLPPLCPMSVLYVCVSTGDTTS